MQAAIVAAQRGHDVRLFEKAERLGGQYYLASIPPTKGEISAFLAWQVHALDQLGVGVHLGTPLTADIVRRHRPDAVIIATGSEPASLQISGIDAGFVVQALDVLEGKITVGEKVAVIGGGMVGCETANHLAHHGKKPTIIEMLSELAPEEPRDMKRFLMESLEEHDVPMYTDSTVQEIAPDGSIRILRGGEDLILTGFESVILAGGMRAVNGLAGQLHGMVDSLLLVGDAVAVRTALEAIEEGYEAALSV